ncbi:MAG: Uma2 family endonuclease [Blastocatellia bacterium]|nr:Uma2 family endonuclease [Blastocatellia bacterium]
MVKPALKSATYADVLAAPVGLIAEIINSELYTSPRPSVLHNVAASRLNGSLMGPFDRGKGGPGGWHILFEQELHIVGQVMVPDLSGWRKVRLPEIPDVVGITVAPDWACEITSPSTRGLDRVIKMPRYAEAGVEWIWIVEPRDRSIEIYQLDRGRYVIADGFEGDAVVHPKPFDAVPFDLSELWSRT